jgi:hypothetical protein
MNNLHRELTTCVVDVPEAKGMALASVPFELSRHNTRSR